MFPGCARALVARRRDVYASARQSPSLLYTDIFERAAAALASTRVVSTGRREKSVARCLYALAIKHVVYTVCMWLLGMTDRCWSFFSRRIAFAADFICVDARASIAENLRIAHGVFFFSYKFQTSRVFKRMKNGSIGYFNKL